MPGVTAWAAIPARPMYGKAVSGPIPLRPSTRPVTSESTSGPSAVRAPVPVIATAALRTRLLATLGGDELDQRVHRREGALADLLVRLPTWNRSSTNTTRSSASIESSPRPSPKIGAPSAIVDGSRSRRSPVTRSSFTSARSCSRGISYSLLYPPAGVHRATHEDRGRVPRRTDIGDEAERSRSERPEQTRDAEWTAGGERLCGLRLCEIERFDLVRPHPSHVERGCRRCRTAAAVTRRVERNPPAEHPAARWRAARVTRFVRLEDEHGGPFHGPPSPLPQTALRQPRVHRVTERVHPPREHRGCLPAPQQACAVRHRGEAARNTRGERDVGTTQAQCDRELAGRGIRDRRGEQARARRRRSTVDEPTLVGGIREKAAERPAERHPEARPRRTLADFEPRVAQSPVPGDEGELRNALDATRPLRQHRRELAQRNGVTVRHDLAHPADGDRVGRHGAPITMAALAPANPDEVESAISTGQTRGASRTMSRFAQAGSTCARPAVGGGIPDRTTSTQSTAPSAPPAPHG